MKLKTDRESQGYAIFLFSSLLFLLAVALLIWRRNHIIAFGVYIPAVKPSDVLIALASFGALAAAMVSHTIQQNFFQNPTVRSWIRRIALFMCFVAVGSLWKWFAFDIPPNGVELEGYIRLVVGIAGFFLTLFFGLGNAVYLKRIFYAFLSPVALIVFLLFSEFYILKWFLVPSPSSYAFLGFQPSNIVLGSALTITLAFLFALYLRTNVKKNRLLLFAIITLLSAIAIWGNSRAGWLSATIGMVVALALAARGQGISAWMKGLASIVCFFSLGFLILAPIARNTALLRVFPYLDTDRFSAKVLKDIILQLPTVTTSVEIPREILIRLQTVDFIRSNRMVFEVGFRESRGVVWSKHSRNFVENPLGAGPDYASMFNEHNTAGQDVNAHSLWLQVAVGAGIGGLIVFLTMLWNIGTGLKKLLAAQRDAVTIGLAAAFVGILVNATFIDSLELRWLWILFGLIVAWCETMKTDIPHATE